MLIIQQTIVKSGQHQSMIYSIECSSIDIQSTIDTKYYFKRNEDETYSHPVSLDLQTIFETQRIINNLIETTLGGNLALADLKRLECQTDDKKTSSGNFSVCISTKN
jgi:hypothetical protein